MMERLKKFWAGVGQGVTSKLVVGALLSVLAFFGGKLAAGWSVPARLDIIDSKISKIEPVAEQVPNIVETLARVSGEMDRHAEEIAAVRQNTETVSRVSGVVDRHTEEIASLRINTETLRTLLDATTETRDTVLRLAERSAVNEVSNRHLTEAMKQMAAEQAALRVRLDMKEEELSRAYE